MKYETDNWPFIQARDFKVWTTKRPVNIIVIHDMEAPETHDTAENIGHYFQHPDKPSSAHVGVDDNGIVQYVKDNNEAYAAPPRNPDAIHVELAGYGRQTRAMWLDPYGIAMLAHGSDAVAQYCLKYAVPIVKLGPADLKAGQRGICGHYAVSLAYGKSDHTDPGVGFPWDYFLHSTQLFYNARKAA